MDRNIDPLTNHDDSRYEIAADWLQRLDDPDLNESDLQSWLEWFGASDANRSAFEELQQLRRKFRQMPAGEQRELGRRVGVSVRSAVSQTKTASLRRRVFRIPTAIAAGISAVALATVVWWNLRLQPDTATYVAPTDRHRAIVLEDGSAAVLATGAEIHVDYSSTLRSLDVRHGAAYFEVRRDSIRPFVVKAGSVTVTALGTAFNVQRDAQNVTVTVTEGRVSTQSQEQPKRELAVGQRAVISIASVSRKAPSTMQPKIPGWDNGRADFIDARLSEVLTVIAAYAPTRLVIDDPRVADLTYSGTILKDHIDEWIASLERVYPIRIVPLEDGTATLVSRPRPEAR